jgi:hypothetical protein
MPSYILLLINEGGNILREKYTYSIKYIIFGNFYFERGRGVKVQNWPHIILKNNA